MADDSSLLAALAVIQTRGAIGAGSLIDAVAHADRFVAQIPADARTLVDLGSGGGLPGLVIGWHRPDLEVTLVERRFTRADLLRRAVSSLSLGAAVTVVATDVAMLCVSAPLSFDVVTARSFASPAFTAECAAVLLRPGGLALISEPPLDRTAMWQAALASLPVLLDGGVEQGIRRLRRVPSAD
jgi:16S rRNA (guanine527-N7)-methyltransferase